MAVYHGSHHVSSHVQHGSQGGFCFDVGGSTELRLQSRTVADLLPVVTYCRSSLQYVNSESPTF